MNRDDYIEHLRAELVALNAKLDTSKFCADVADDLLAELADAKETITRYEVTAKNCDVLRAELANQLEVKAFWIGRTRALEVELAAIKSAQVAKQRLEGLLQRVQVAMSLDDAEWGYSGTEKYTLLADIKAALSTANGEVTK